MRCCCYVEINDVLKYIFVFVSVQIHHTAHLHCGQYSVAKIHRIQGGRPLRVLGLLAQIFNGVGRGDRGVRTPLS